MRDSIWFYPVVFDVAVVLPVVVLIVLDPAQSLVVRVAPAAGLVVLHALAAVIMWRHRYPSRHAATAVTAKDWLRGRPAHAPLGCSPGSWPEQPAPARAGPWAIRPWSLSVRPAAGERLGEGGEGLSQGGTAGRLDPRAPYARPRVPPPRFAASRMGDVAPLATVCGRIDFPEVNGQRHPLRRLSESVGAGTFAPNAVG